MLRYTYSGCVVITEMACVYCAVWIEILNVIKVNIILLRVNPVSSVCRTCNFAVRHKELSTFRHYAISTLTQTRLLALSTSSFSISAVSLPYPIPLRHTRQLSVDRRSSVELFAVSPTACLQRHHLWPLKHVSDSVIRYASNGVHKT
jgi:hypothetical protein